MAGMQVKKNGKVEHSDQTHDDQVFSYLLALYVWYDGKNIMDNWHIQKNTIRTDEDIEFEDSLITNPDASLEPLDFNQAQVDEEDKDSISKTLEWVEYDSKNMITAEQMRDLQSDELRVMRSTILSNNEKAREAYAKQTGVDPISLIDNEYITNQVSLPSHIFDISDDDDIYPSSFTDEDDEFNMIPKNTYLQGNLANMLTKIK